MGVLLHWFLPTNGDSRSDLSLGNPVGAAGSRVLGGGPARAPEVGYLGLTAQAAEQLGFDGALTPTSSWGEPPDAVAEKLDRVRERAQAARRELRFGIRLHVIARDTSAQAWAKAQELLDGLDPEAIERAQTIQRASQSEGQRRMVALHSGQTDALEVSPNLWAGVGLVRGGAGTALVGSHEEVADRIAEYHGLGIDEFILSGYPHLEEAYRVGEGVMPVLDQRGLLALETPRHETVEV